MDHSIFYDKCVKSYISPFVVIYLTEFEHFEQFRTLKYPLFLWSFPYCKYMIIALMWWLNYICIFYHYYGYIIKL